MVAFETASEIFGLGTLLEAANPDSMQLVLVGQAHRDDIGGIIHLNEARRESVGLLTLAKGVHLD